MSQSSTPAVVVSGHLCLDLYPALDTVPLQALASPGQLFEAGQMSLSTGGAVSNTGLALHRLGVPVQLVATVGDDLLGQVILSFLQARDPDLIKLIKIQPGQSTSYTVLLSPENVDRIILHNVGTNATFGAADVNAAQVAGAKIFHLGYPPILPRLYANNGAELTQICRSVQAAGVITSLDTAQPDPSKASGKADWRTILANTLPFVDIFVPSIEEILYMLRRADYDAWGTQLYQHLTRDYLHELTSELLDWGTSIVGCKLSQYGMYLHTRLHPAAQARLAQLPVNWEVWAHYEGWHPAFQVQVVGTTGAGDSAYAALLASLLRGLPPDETLRLACAVGACNVEAADATSGIQSWEATQARLAAGWAVRDLRPAGFLAYPHPLPPRSLVAE